MFHPILTACRILCAAAIGGSFLAGQALAAEAIEAKGRGVQIYGCAAAGDSFAWRLNAPEATLTDTHGVALGTHFAGPSWRAQDGSIVVAEPIAASGSGTGSIPWLVLRAKSHEGVGVFSGVGYVVRTHTVGGVAPTAGCDREHAGTEVRVEYSATYLFFSG